MNDKFKIGTKVIISQDKNNKDYCFSYQNCKGRIVNYYSPTQVIVSVNVNLTYDTSGGVVETYFDIKDLIIDE